MTHPADPRVIVALDFDREADALALAERLDPAQCRLKIGKSLFTRCGPPLVRRLVDAGFAVFLDLKFHDIPNTVAGACRAAADLGVWMVNVHALGGRRMMGAAREALAGPEAPLLTAVTVLTSLERADLAEIGLDAEPAATVDRLAALAHDSGLDGLVCSAAEAERLRGRYGPGWTLVTPGIRPAGAAGDDQRRVSSPGEALRAGASYLVIGRPITASDNPVGQLLTINSELRSILDS